jgi:hypothetical protein
VAECLLLLAVCQQQGERQDYAFNWTPEFARAWEADHPYSAGTRIRPSKNSVSVGFELTSSGGQSGGTEPNWRSKIKLAGEVLTEGGITWTAAALSNSSLRHRIVTADWTADADGQTLSDQEEQDSPGLQETRIWVEGGEPGETYDHVVLVTTDQGAKFKGILRVTVDDTSSSA